MNKKYSDVFKKQAVEKFKCGESVSVISKEISVPRTTIYRWIAYYTREPNEKLLFHSDQGANYTSRTFRAYLKEKNVEQSFSRRGIPYDNSVCESFFGIYKQEEFYRRNYKTEAELKKGIHSFMNFYNTKRPHSILRYRTPEAYESEYFSIIKDKEGFQTEQ